MKTCNLCTTLEKKSSSAKPHQYLSRISESRTFRSTQVGGFVEQDFQCLRCQARFTHSTNKNDFGWTLWQG